MSTTPAWLTKSRNSWREGGSGDESMVKASRIEGLVQRHTIRPSNSAAALRATGQFEKRVVLDFGNKSEAMHVIDVNSGGPKEGGKSSQGGKRPHRSPTWDVVQEHCTFCSDLMDIGGIRAIASIDMAKREDNVQLTDAMAQLRTATRPSTTSPPPSRDLGVMEMTRQRVRDVAKRRPKTPVPGLAMVRGKVEASIFDSQSASNRPRSTSPKGKTRTRMTGWMVRTPCLRPPFPTQGWWKSIRRNWQKAARQTSWALESNSTSRDARVPFTTPWVRKSPRIERR